MLAVSVTEVDTADYVHWFSCAVAGQMGNNNNNNHDNVYGAVCRVLSLSDCKYSLSPLSQT